jgi:hypothetical protein
MIKHKVLKVPADWKHPTQLPKYVGGHYELLLDRDSEPDGEHVYMPDWPEASCTHYQMYEIYDGVLWAALSPVMATPEALTDWLLRFPKYAYWGYVKTLSFVKESSEIKTK